MKLTGPYPILEWLDELPGPAVAKCRVKLERLKELGHELRRPEGDFLRDGIYELRVRLHRINYRMLYFFHRHTAAVLSHGILKESEIPPREIDRALDRKRQFVSNPAKHTFEEA